jgi:hypothetical protein
MCAGRERNVTGLMPFIFSNKPKKEINLYDISITIVQEAEIRCVGSSKEVVAQQV